MVTRNLGPGRFQMMQQTVINLFRHFKFRYQYFDTIDVSQNNRAKFVLTVWLQAYLFH